MNPLAPTHRRKCSCGEFFDVPLTTTIGASASYRCLTCRKKPQPRRTRAPQQRRFKGLLKELRAARIADQALEPDGSRETSVL